jgi:hypothetical protein
LVRKRLWFCYCDFSAFPTAAKPMISYIYMVIKLLKIYSKVIWNKTKVRSE